MAFLSPSLSEKTFTQAISGDEERGIHGKTYIAECRSANDLGLDPAPEVQAPSPKNAGNAHIQMVNAAQRFWNRLQGKGRRSIGWGESAKNILSSSWLNVLLLIIPIAWVSHWMRWGPKPTFILNFFAIIPLEGLLDWGGEQMAMYLGKNFGDLLIITLHNAVEAVLAIVLLKNCDLRLLQTTIVGVVILHLLLIPGVAFFVGGSRTSHQVLSPRLTDLNRTLLATGVFAILLSTAYFATLDHDADLDMQTSANGIPPFVNDKTRDHILRISRGIAVVLFDVYIASRIYLYTALSTQDDDEPEVLKQEKEHLEEEEPSTNPWLMLIVLGAAIGTVAITTEFLVDSIKGVREDGRIKEEWFGLILLPIVSFSADGAVAILFFLQSIYARFKKHETVAPSMIGRGRTIDLSIQFILGWMPFIVLLGWWIGKPIHLLFGTFEVVILIVSCFLVNYITADAKTNWIEGLVMVSFYVIIALTAWFYPGQQQVKLMLKCVTIAEAVVARGAEVAEFTATAATEAATELVATGLPRMM